MHRPFRPPDHDRLRMMRVASRLYLVIGVSLTLLYLWIPTQPAKLYVWPIIGWSSVIAIVVGFRVNHSATRAWYVLAAGVATLIIGDNVFSFRTIVVHSHTPFPSPVDVIYLSMYPLLFCGLAMLVHRRSSGKDRAGFLDAAIITAGVGLVSWVFLIAPYVREDHLGLFERLVSMAYPLGDLALLAVAARLAVGSGGRRAPAFWMLTGGLVALMGADALYGSANLAGTWSEHNVVDIGWAAFYIGWGAAALHPSMRELSSAALIRKKVAPARMIAVGSAVLIPPTMLYIEDVTNVVTDGAAIATISVVLFILVVVRIAGFASNAAAERSEKRFRAMVHHSSDAVVVVDSNGRVQYWTPSAERVFSRTGPELDGSRLADFLCEADGQHLAVMLTNGLASTRAEWQIRHGRSASDGDQLRSVEVVAADLRGTRDVDGIVLTLRDVTERNRLDGELRRQALHDALTGLPNRTLFLDRVEQSLQRGERLGASVAVLLFGVDDFQTINVAHGHAAGDELLKAISARLTKLSQAGDTVARLAGDEFALVIEHDKIEDVLELAALRIQTGLLEPFAINDEQIAVRVSAGIAIATTGVDTPQSLIRDADLAMYVAKRNGKNRVERYTPAMHEQASRSLQLAAELRVAIDDEQLVVFFQPIVDLGSGRTRAAEALVRWQHPTRGLVQPVEFIPIAEATGMIVDLDRWVLREACRVTQEWKQAGIIDDAFYISVNLSGRQVQDLDVVDDVRSALVDSGLAPSALVLEITETTLIDQLAPAQSALAALKHLGVRIAVDDFGTGYSSLSRLSHFPLDILKIDKSFIDHVATTSEGETMVRAVLELAHTLGLIAVAEGVEATEQAKILRRLDCPLAQGYLFAKPAPAAQMLTFLGRRMLHLNP